MPYSVKGFLIINEDMVQTLLMLGYFSQRILRLKSNYLFSLGFKQIQDDFQHDFTRMTVETDSSVVLAEL